MSRGFKLLLIYAVLLAPLVTATLPVEQRWRMRLVTVALTLALWLGWP